MPTAGQSRTYTIQRGDSLLSIARRFGLTVKQLQQANNITNPDRIYPGRPWSFRNSSQHEIPQRRLEHEATKVREGREAQGARKSPCRASRFCIFCRLLTAALCDAAPASRCPMASYFAPLRRLRGSCSRGCRASTRW